MDLAHPYGVLSHRLDGAALTVLAGTTQPLTGRQVARLASEGTQQGIAKALGRLVEQGLVLRSDAGSANLFALNREHLAAPAGELLARLRPALFERLRDALRGWKTRPLHASVFGSASRGDGGTDSDIDILIIRPRAVEEDDARWRSQLEDLANRVYRWTGNRAAISEIAEQDIERLARDRPPIVDEIVADALALVGVDARQLFERPA